MMYNAMKEEMSSVVNEDLPLLKLLDCPSTEALPLALALSLGYDVFPIDFVSFLVGPALLGFGRRDTRTPS